ncbi:polyphosphate polymerase domain-containing protein [Rossellomorea sp. RS05]|uniref:polyphosphate polymerase domain-containing protein n=1 Tax=Rossellomorea sp. RS05 TaxID=3149166 RepID=UPI003221D64F
MSQIGRKELKFAISIPKYHILIHKLKWLMTRDENAGRDGKYHIRSAYFDNMDDRILTEKKEGYLNRDKYRVRIYNLSTSVIHLERKSKRNNQTFKTKCPLTRKEYEAIRRGETEWMEDDVRPLIRDLYGEMKRRLIKPVAVVDYEREAFTYPYGNVRITFDQNIRTSLRNTAMFDRNLPMVPVMEEPLIILEVKFDEYLPDMIKYALQAVDTRTEAYSKYQLSRMFG